MSRVRAFSIVSPTKSRPGRLLFLTAAMLFTGGPSGCKAAAPQATEDTLGVDVSVTQSVTVAAPAEGGLTSFVIRARNNGPVVISDVVGLDSLATGLVYDSHAITGHGGFDPVSNQWTIGRLALNEEVGLTLFARPRSGSTGQTLSNVVRVAVTSPLLADTVTSNNRTSASITVGAALPPASFANEPPGFTALSNQIWPTHESGGWRWEGANSTTGAFQSVVSSGYGSAPPSGAGGPNVLQATYVAGSLGGFGAGRTYFALPSVNEVFVGFWHKFAADYVASPNSNKMWFMMMGNERAFLGFRDRVEDSPRRVYNLNLSSFGPTPNVALAADPPISIPLGEWYKLEWYFKRNTSGQSNGIIRVWMNGILIHDYANLVFPGPMTTFYFEGTHNGVDGFVPAAMQWWVSRAYVSVPSP